MAEPVSKSAGSAAPDPCHNERKTTVTSDLAERTATPSGQARQEQARQDGAYLARECADAWRGFGQQPETHLRLVRAGAVRRELRTAEQQMIASLRDLRPTARDLLPTVISAGGRTYTWKKVTRSAWPGIAEIVRPSPGRYFFEADTPPSPRRPAKARSQKSSRAARRRRNPLRELLDQTGAPILYTSGENYFLRAGACITFPDQRWLRFPVRGTTRANAIMTAVDQAGNKVARYRIIGKLRRTILPNTMEITVHPRQPLTDELALAIVISAPWLSLYFSAPN